MQMAVHSNAVVAMRVLFERRMSGILYRVSGVEGPEKCFPA